MSFYTSPPDLALNLAFAVVVSSNAPLVLLDADLRVLAVSTSFCSAFHIDPAAATDRSLFELGAGEWNVPQLRSLLKATASGFAEVQNYEMELRPEGGEVRCLILNAQKLDYADASNTRLLLAVADVTDARIAQKLKDDLLRDKSLLLQEVHHRVANSLQIIASVLMQTARKSPSEETRGHLQDAHNRVMSVAALQQQLAATEVNDVQLQPYFSQLCHSIGASMIRDHDLISLKVDVDGSTTKADVSISLGLIVTELVINALKHAFPGGHGGKIVVGYQSKGPDWTLTVGDNGVGMPEGAKAKAGLGTSIVEALAKQQHARVQVARAKPGTIISIIHTMTDGQSIPDVKAV
jgi:two-component sensor histidine kinase